MAVFEFKNVTKFYGANVRAIDDFNLLIPDGEFTLMVGPSGCGKSTALRMIAGLEDISRGELLMDGKIINHVPPQKREAAMVFQSYALYPHLSVYDNMAFPLKIKKQPKDLIDERVRDVAQILGLSELISRMPRELSGGQKQRVALGRAMVREPKVFLFDEPLSNLDAALRAEMRIEIAELHSRLKTNFIYVTHDQVEAVTLGQKIVVLKDGKVQQYATPHELFRRPANTFVAGFIGTPPMNFLKMGLRRADDGYEMITENLHIPLHPTYRPNFDQYKKESIIAGIRPKDLSLRGKTALDKADKRCTIKGRFLLKEVIGDDVLYYFDLSTDATDGKPLIVKANVSLDLDRKQTVDIFIDIKEIYLFDIDSGKTLIQQ
ncbi:MAG: ABC transporter ATP-binding protein [Deltaproteobacteria bacterium]|nr:ABC transporter ATP-binding protein [Deltaproteobacteria bacterium]